eukprot:1176131-Pyramimonas_sp.AAC.1
MPLGTSADHGGKIGSSAGRGMSSAFRIPKVMSSFLDSMKTINDYDEGEAKFKGLVTAVLNRTSLPKPAVDDMKAISVYFIWKDKAVDSSNVAPMKSGVQAAVARLTQKKDSSCYLALLKRKKPAPYEMAVKGLTDMMKT